MRARSLSRSISAAAALGIAATALQGQGVRADWNPTAREVVLNTEVQQISTSVGVTTVRGGVFVFRNVWIPRGTTVRGVGKNPLIFVCAGTLRIEGEISVRGQDGRSVQTLRSANFPAPGGRAHCGGGDGGPGSWKRTDRSFFGGTGYGPLQIPGFGGRGGRINCASGACGIGSGGGGGTFATRGDPHYPIKPAGTFVQPTGRGGYGCRARNSTALAGGVPGQLYFRDGNPGNDFFGIGYDVNRRRFVVGELPVLAGGSGGGGGGDYGLSCATNDPNFVNDEKGGGGGAGGGCFVAIVSGLIRIGASGSVVADGGHGGGGAFAGSSNRAGGGGAGAGGMVALYTRTAIDITIHGETYANRNYDFAISADGGVGLLSPYGGGGNVKAKYPLTSSANMNARVSGGFGGMGIIQLMAPPLSSTPDGTNTALDDNIILRDGNTILTGAEKQRYLAWRGFPDAQGVWRDDAGRAINIGDKEGDFRPSPTLLPVF